MAAKELRQRTEAKLRAEMVVDVRTLPAMEGLDLFAGCFQLATFVCWDGGFKASCTDDTRPQPFLHQWEFVRKYKPRIAILLTSHYEDLQPDQRTHALRFVLDGKDKNTHVADKGEWALRPLHTR